MSARARMKYESPGYPLRDPRLVRGDHEAHYKTLSSSTANKGVHDNKVTLAKSVFGQMRPAEENEEAAFNPIRHFNEAYREVLAKQKAKADQIKDHNLKIQKLKKQTTSKERANKIVAKARAFKKK